MTVEITTQELFDLLSKRLEMAKLFDAKGATVMAYQNFQDAALVFEAIEIRLKKARDS